MLHAATCFCCDRRLGSTAADLLLQQWSLLLVMGHWVLLVANMTWGCHGSSLKACFAWLLKHRNQWLCMRVAILAWRIGAFSFLLCGGAQASAAANSVIILPSLLSVAGCKLHARLRTMNAPCVFGTLACSISCIAASVNGLRVMQQGATSTLVNMDPRLDACTTRHCVVM